MQICFTGSGDDCEKRRDDSNGLGREHSVLGDCIQRGYTESGTRRPSLVAAAEQSLTLARLYVYDVLWVLDLRKLNERHSDCSLTMAVRGPVNTIITDHLVSCEFPVRCQLFYVIKID